jgi:hypothetical protein
MEYTTSGKFCYKVIDGKKVRISKVEYENRVKKPMKKKGGGDEIDW